MNFRPIPALEIGFTRTAQWGGEGRPSDLRTFADLLVGNDNVSTTGGITLAEEPGNQLAGVDFHLRHNLFGQPFGLYGEFIGEDESGGLAIPPDVSSRYGNLIRQPGQPDPRFCRVH